LSSCSEHSYNLLTPAGKIESLEIHGDREGQFVTELFKRCKGTTFEEAILEMYSLGISMRKIAGVFACLYFQRPGMEGSISQGVRAFGLRQARYRGLKRTHLQELAQGKNSRKFVCRILHSHGPMRPKSPANPAWLRP
jgi:Transposase, Mutator family